MAKITVRIKQLATAAALQNVDVLPARALGWAKDIRSLCITQDDGSDGADGYFRIPSTVGDGMGRRISKTAHGFTVGEPLHLDVSSEGVSTWSPAQATSGGALLTTHIVVAVPNANAFDVARSGSWSIPGLPSGVLYTSATAGSLTATIPTDAQTQRVGIYDGSTLHLTISGDVNLDELVDELDARDDLLAIPKGTAGGDLAESYANPVVKQITGVGAALVSVDTDVSYTEETRESDPPSGGRGISPGRHFRTINGTATDERCWCASDEYGEAFWSHDYFKTSVKDSSIRTAGPTASGYTSCYRWGTRRFVYMAGSINSYAWITGCGRANGSRSSGVPGIFYAKHEAASYAADGSMLESAWHYLAWTTVGGVSGINGLNKAAEHDGTLVWLGDSQYIARTDNFADFAFVADGGSDYRFSGVSHDSYGNWGALGQWGDLWKSSVVDGKEGTAFAKLTSINISYDGGKTYAAATKLPGGSSELGGLRWSSLLCCYGLWLGIVYTPGTSGYAYAYSEDFENWIVYSGSALTRFYDASTDGVRWFATNLYPNTAGSAAVPPIYQLLVDSANVKKRLNLEKGMAVSGPVFMLDLQNAKILGTDANGKEIDASKLLTLDDLKDVDTTTTAPTNGQVLEFNDTSKLWVPSTVSSIALATETPLVESGAGDVGTSAKAARADHVHPASASSATYAKYAPTMDPVLAISQIAIPNGTTSQWAMTGTMLIPPADMSLTANVSSLAMICPQPASGGHYLYALYAYNTDKSLSLVLSTAINTMPSSSSWLEAIITNIVSQPLGGQKYYFVIFNDCNAAQFEGITAAQNLNIYPLPGIQKDASFQNFTAAPATIAYGGYTENATRYFGRIKT